MPAWIQSVAVDGNRVKRILVVGDWIVDEHWVTGIHRSPTSSRTGQTHRRALHSLTARRGHECVEKAGRGKNA
jgi:hypothetical protein